MCFLVRSGCCSKIPETELLRNNRDAFLLVETWKSKIKALADLVSGKGLFHGSCVLTGWKE